MLTGEEPCILFRKLDTYPAGAVLGGAERVSVVFARRDGTLGHAIDAVHLGRVGLSESVPVNRRPVVFQLVLDGDLDQIAPAGLDPRSGVAPVEDLAALVDHTIGIDGLVFDLQVVLTIQIRLNEKLDVTRSK